MELSCASSEGPSPRAPANDNRDFNLIILSSAIPTRANSFAALLLTIASILTAVTTSPTDVEAAARVKLQAAIQKCGTAKRITCVVDGDTLWLNGQKIRVADIDTPEISEPKCASELARGNRATDRFIALINKGPFELHAWPGRDTDRYGRALRVIVRDGRSLGDILVSEGLARTWTGRREPWCGQ
jgi:endonuclease YncB( thermonuclease family)